MNPLNERYADLLADRDDFTLLECVADLDATCSAFALPPERDAALTRALTEANGANRRVPVTRPWFRAPWQTARWRLGSLTLAVLLAAGGIGGYLHGPATTPVNAQTVLHRAAAASPGPNEAAHSTYRLSASGGYTGTAQVWVGADASGAPTEFALTVSMVRDGTPAPELSSRRVLTGPTTQVYDPASNTVTISSSGAADQELEGMFDGVLVAQKLSRVLEVAQQPHPFKLQQQTLDGVPVYALEIEGPGSQTFYFNTQSYILEGADWVQGGRSWQARLDPASYQTTALSSVPADTFTLNAPASAHVVTETSPETSKGRPDGGDAIISTGAAACNTTPEAFAAAVQAGDRSMLAVCQETSPGMTVDRLVAALMAPFKAKLDGQVASGAITPAEEADELAALQTKLTRMVTGQPSTNPGGKQP